MAKKHTKKHAKHSDAKHTESQPQQSNWLTLLLIAVVIALVAYIAVDKLQAPTTDPVVNETVSEPVIIEEFTDFQCPFCARAVPTKRAIKEKYGDNVKFELKHFPLNFHPQAKKAAEAAECARDQGKVEEYYYALFDNQDALAVANLKQYAADLGLDTGTFNACLDSGTKSSIVEADLAEGRDRGVSGTPTFFIDGETLVGAQPQREFEKLIDAALGTETVQEEDPVIELTVITDPSCTVCESEQIIEVLQTKIFPTLEVTRLTVDDEGAQSTLEGLDIPATPAFVFSPEVADAEKFADLEQALQPVGGKYVLIPAAIGTVKLLEAPEIEGRPMLGEDDAPITMVVYDDFECPFCKRFEDETFPALKENYIDTGEVRFVYKHFPLGFHEQAVPAALASECAHEQGMFWEMHNMIFANQEDISEENYKQWAEDLGLDTAEFNECFDSQEYLEQVQLDMQQGQNDGISGTPGFVINNVVVSGALPFEMFQEMLDEMLEQ